VAKVAEPEVKQPERMKTPTVKKSKSPIPSKKEEVREALPAKEPSPPV